MKGGSTNYYYKLKKDDNYLPAENGNINITGLGKGDYTLQYYYSSENGDCSSGTLEQNFTINGPEPLVYDSKMIKNVSCNNAQDGKIQYTWTGGAKPFTVLINNKLVESDYNERTYINSTLIGGEYVVTVISNTGCEQISSESILIFEPQPLEVSHTIIKQYCIENTADVNLTVSGGNGKYEYEWYKVVGFNDEELNIYSDKSIGINADFNYKVIVSDPKGCSVEYIIDDLKIPPMEIQLSIKDSLLCFEGNNASIKVEVISGFPAKLVLKQGDVEIETVEEVNDSHIFGGLEKGSYKVVATSPAECYDVRTIIVAKDLQKLKFTKFDIVKESCLNSADVNVDIDITGGTSPYTYLWDDGVTTKNRSDLISGEHNITVTDANACSIFKSFTTKPGNDIQIENLYLSELSCHNSDDAWVDFTPVGGTYPYQYFFNGEEVELPLKSLPAGIHDIEVIDALGCTKIVEAEFDNPPLLTLDMGGDEVLCVEQSIEKTAPDYAVTYHWTSDKGFNKTTKSVTINDAAEYTLDITDGNGCKASDTFVIEKRDDLLVADFLVATEAFTDEEVSAINITNTPYDNYTWIKPEGVWVVDENEQSLNIKFDNEGKYDLGLYLSLSSCDDQIFKTINIYDKNNIDWTDEENVPLVKEFNIFPNPSQGEFEVEIELTKIPEFAELKIYRIADGLVVFNQSINVSKINHIPINIRSKPPGVYVVVFVSENVRKVKQVIKR